MRTIALFLLFFPVVSYAQSTSIVGQWQLVNQSNCVEDELGSDDEEMSDSVADMKRKASRSPHVIVFKENHSGKESTRIISSKKNYDSNSFLYRFDGRGLYFLDKKSQTIIEGYSVEKLKSDTLIITNSTRVCETKIFVRLK